VRTVTTASRFHDFSYGHRVVNHESKCAHLHGHNGRVTFTVIAEDLSNPLDSIGRVIDFSVIKTKLCNWVEQQWDHKFLVFDQDPFLISLTHLDPFGVVTVFFNPTAENMAAYLLNEVGPKQLVGTGVKLVKVVVEETRKCSATVYLNKEAV
jgi:6-pyruvoyltetrahydropterin/6-carboxytetrahydropterin synthase